LAKIPACLSFNGNFLPTFLGFWRLKPVSGMYRYGALVLCWLAYRGFLAVQALWYGWLAVFKFYFASVLWRPCAQVP
jgi:hypothetical protein